jgi:hypothetical protein
VLSRGSAIWLRNVLVVDEMNIVADKVSTKAVYQRSQKGPSRKT